MDETYVVSVASRNFAWWNYLKLLKMHKFSYNPFTQSKASDTEQAQELPSWQLPIMACSAIFFGGEFHASNFCVVVGGLSLNDNFPVD
jgi:hypothetical protein